MNTKVEKIAAEAFQVFNKLDENYAEMFDVFARQIVGETILAIMATDHRNHVYTTFDRDMAAGITSRIVDQVRNHWSFK